jgi:hypothetical protein
MISSAIPTRDSARNKIIEYWVLVILSPLKQTAVSQIKKGLTLVYFRRLRLFIYLLLLFVTFQVFNNGIHIPIIEIENLFCLILC